MIKPITQLGTPSLRETSISVTDSGSEEVKKVIQDMIETLADSGGVGIAAPQIGVNLRLFVVSTINSNKLGVEQIPPMAFINPEIVKTSKETIFDWEGCSSVMTKYDQCGVRGRLARSKWLDLKYLASDGSSRTERFYDHLARIIQHEIDHLNGKVFIDRIKSTDLVSEKYYQEKILGKTK